MTFQPSGPGKTAPKVYQDFLAFDPLKGRPNVLADHTPPHGEGPQPASPIGSCRHDYTTKFTQSVQPPLDLRPDGNTIYKLAVVCKKCRIHADVWIDYSNSTNPCPTSDHPLHHFRRATFHDNITSDRIRYAWQCSVGECRTTLYIIFRLPRLDSDSLGLLTNPELLKRRYSALVEDDPSREGIRQATEMEALQRLRRYIHDSLNPQHNKRQFPANNKRFQEAFGLEGQDCSELLERLGFKYAEHNWHLPHPEQIQDRLQTDGDSHLEVLEDVEIELLACMFEFASKRGLMNPQAGEGWSSANRDIERTLAAQGYTRHVPLRRTATSNAEIPFFNSLGAIPEFSDSLIEYAFDRQTICDPERQAYYFECLQEITESRNTEQLQMKVATLQSQDIVSRRDISAGYRFLNIPPGEGNNIDDARIIELYQAQQPDLGAVAQEQARTHLYKLGLSRGSSALINASRQFVERYEEALAWLGNGVNKDTPDESILAVLAIKTGESETKGEIAQRAISVIAKARQSNVLNNWLLAGRTDGYSMSVDEALRHLNIEQKLEEIDGSILPAIFDSARQDRPGENTNKAIATIQQALSNASNIVAHSPDTWPVGLTSHGNTCYLNSLLQYYFSIRPLREIILNYDEYKLDTSTHAEKEERVGQRKVSPVEIKGGQRFADDLKHLFERMIKSSDLTVKPEEDLVCRAFLDPKEYRLLDPGLRDEKVGDDHNPVVNGIESSETIIDAEPLASPAEAVSEDKEHSGASSMTLQASVNGDDTDVDMKNVEMPPTPPASPGLKGDEQETEVDSAPPPLPPRGPRRRFSTGKEEALQIAQAKARQQQDVTEVHDGAMFRLRCGMMPRGQDTGEEQEDALRDLFSIRIEETIVNDGVPQHPKTLTDSNIQLNVPYEPIDIYSALDAVFDLQPYGESSAMETFKSITAPPPLLQVNIPRIGFSNGAYKSTECVRLDDELYLDRYFNHSHPSTLAKRKRCWDRRKQLQRLKLEQKIVSKTPMDLDGPTIISQTVDYLSSLDEVNRDLESIGVEPIDADGDITSALATEAEEQSSLSGSLESRINELQKSLDAEFADMKNIKYRLAAIFFHRGAHGHGHYWIYIHDFANDVWRIYNDERVEEFTKLDEIFEAKTWQQGTPTYAVYVSEDKMHLIQAVCRDPEKPAKPDPAQHSQTGGDVEMGEVRSQQDSATTIDPKLLTTEGGQSSWDPERQVVDGVKW